MRAITVLLLIACLAGCADRANRSPITASCLSAFAPSCGCTIVLPASACPHSGVHFFHELHQGAPLVFNFGNGDELAVSDEPKANYFIHGRGDSWLEQYTYHGGVIEIHYSPGAPTCAKVEHGEECEYFDVNAEVIVSAPSGHTRFAGAGRCGC